MTKTTHCRKCGDPIPLYVQSVQSEPDSADWVRTGYCSRICFRDDQTKSTDEEPQSRDELVQEPVEEYTEDLAEEIAEEQISETEEECQEESEEELVDEMREDLEEQVPDEVDEELVDILPEETEDTGKTEVLVTDSRKVATEAYIAFLASIIGLFFLGLIVGTAAIVISIRAKRKIKELPKYYKGVALANIAFFLGILDIVGGIIIQLGLY